MQDQWGQDNRHMMSFATPKLKSSLGSLVEVQIPCVLILRGISLGSLLKGFKYITPQNQQVTGLVFRKIKAKEECLVMHSYSILE